MLKIQRDVSAIVDLRHREAIDLIRGFRDAVNARREQLIEAGVVITVAGYGPVALQGRPEDQTSLLGLAVGAQLRISFGDTQTAMSFMDRDNIEHQLTPMQLIDLWRQGAAFVSDVYARSWEIKSMDPTTTDPSTWGLK